MSYSKSALFPAMALAILVAAGSWLSPSLKSRPRIRLKNHGT